MNSPISLSAAIRALFIGAVFVVSVLLIQDLGNYGRFTLSEWIALLTGAVTASALVGVYLQIQTTQDGAREREKQRNLELAVRADQLHMEFNAPDMRQHRDIAYTYLQYLRDDPEQLVAFTRSWVYGENSPILEHVNQSVGTTKLTFKECSWSVSVMIAFYVRVASHIKFYDDRVGSLTAEDMARVIGPFFWQYWADAGVRALVDKCAELQHSEPSPYGTPYFINPLDDLEAFSKRAAQAKLLRRPVTDNDIRMRTEQHAYVLRASSGESEADVLAVKTDLTA